MTLTLSVVVAVRSCGGKTLRLAAIGRMGPLQPALPIFTCLLSRNSLLKHKVLKNYLVDPKQLADVGNVQQLRGIRNGTRTGLKIAPFVLIISLQIHPIVSTRRGTFNRTLI